MPGRRPEPNAAERRTEWAFRLGAFGMLVSFGLWIAVDRFNPAIFAGFGALVTASYGSELAALLRSGPERPAMPMPEPKDTP